MKSKKEKILSQVNAFLKSKKDCQRKGKKKPPRTVEQCSVNRSMKVPHLIAVFLSTATWSNNGWPARYGERSLENFPFFFQIISFVLSDVGQSILYLFTPTPLFLHHLNGPLLLHLINYLSRSFKSPKISSSGEKTAASPLFA